MSPRTLRVVSQRAWMARDLADALNPDVWTVTAHHGLSVPHGIDPGDAWWMPGAFAARLHRVGALPELAAPAPGFLPGLPRRFVQRTIRMHAAGDAARTRTSGFWKLADAKTDLFPAGWRGPEHLSADIRAARLPDSTLLLCSDHAPFGAEYRAFIVDGKVTGGSWYLDETGRGFDHPAFTPPARRAAQAEQFAAEVAAWCHQHGHAPRAYTLDVAWGLRAATWLVVEANPVWSSAWYGTNLAAAAGALAAARLGAGG